MFPCHRVLFDLTPVVVAYNYENSLRYDPNFSRPAKGYDDQITRSLELKQITLQCT